MSDYERGEFDTLNLLSSAWHGKQYYFVEDEERGIIYSRESCKNMSLDDAISEFADKLGWDGEE